MAYLGVYGAKEYSELIEEFATTCHQCRGLVPHGRFEITVKDTIFWMPFRTLGSPRAILRCRRCGHESHIRDAVDLASPTLNAKYTYALRAAVIELLGVSPPEAARTAAISAVADHYSLFTTAELDADRAAHLGRELGTALTALREEAGPHIVHRFIAQLVPVASAAGDVDSGSLRAIATALYVSDADLDRIVASPADDA